MNGPVVERRRLRWLLGIALTAVILLGSANWAGRKPFLTDANRIREPISQARVRDILWEPPQQWEGTGAADHYEPRVGPDDRVLYSVRGRAGGHADIFVSVRADSGWGAAVPLDSLNSEYDDLGPSPSADGRFLFFYSDRPGGMGGYDLWMAERSDGSREAFPSWGPPRNLGSGVNSPYNEYGPALTPKTDRLYFASNRPNPDEDAKDQGASFPAWPATIREDIVLRPYDLFMVHLDQGDPDISSLRPLTEINTVYQEGTPAVSPVGDFLYFSSNRPEGCGGFDLYRARRLGEGFRPVEHLGCTVNSQANDLDPGPALGGFALFFSSDRGDDRAGTQAERPADGPRSYHVYHTVSREVFRDVDYISLFPGWVSLSGGWSSTLPWALLTLLLLLLILALARSAAERELSLVARCLLGSLAFHLLLLLVFSLWNVTTNLAGRMPRSGLIRVSLGASNEWNTASAQLTGRFGSALIEVDPTTALPDPIQARFVARDADSSPVHVDPIQPDPDSGPVMDRREVVEIEPPARLAASSAVTLSLPNIRESDWQPTVTAFVVPPLGRSPRETNDHPDPLRADLSDFNLEQVRLTSDRVTAPTDMEPIVEVSIHTPRATAGAASEVTFLTPDVSVSSTSLRPDAVRTRERPWAVGQDGLQPVVPRMPEGSSPRHVSKLKEVAPLPGLTLNEPLGSSPYRLESPEGLPVDSSVFVPREDVLGRIPSREAILLNENPPPPTGTPSPAWNPGSFSMNLPSSADSSWLVDPVSFELPGQPPPPPTADSDSRSPVGRFPEIPSPSPMRAQFPATRIAANEPSTLIKVVPLAARTRETTADSLSPSIESANSMTTAPVVSWRNIFSNRDSALTSPLTSSGGAGLPAFDPLLPEGLTVLEPPVSVVPEPPVPRRDEEEAADADRSPIGNIEGRVTDSATIAPLSAATVRLDLPAGGTVEVSTDAQGRYRLPVPPVPDYFALTTTREGYVPKSLNVPASDVRGETLLMDISLDRIQGDVLVIEPTPDVHHLGDNRYDGLINSQFQREAQGRVFRVGFHLSELQMRRCDRLVELTFLAKGVQMRHRLYVNESLLETRLEESPRNGSFGPFRVRFDSRLLQIGPNRLMIVASQRSGDIDDFEFVNLKLQLRPDLPG